MMLSWFSPPPLSSPYLSSIVFFPFSLLYLFFSFLHFLSPPHVVTFSPPLLFLSSSFLFYLLSLLLCSSPLSSIALVFLTHPFPLLSFNPILQLPPPLLFSLPPCIPSSPLFSFSPLSSHPVVFLTRPFSPH